LYNRTIAGLSMSFTNVSLVPDEMLAAGNIPVVNELPFARSELPSPYAVWAQPAPIAMADALSGVVETPNIAARAGAAASAIRGGGWSSAQTQVVSVVEEELYGTLQ
ncbi:hypothetical protein, partial [Mycobacterium sp.]|uniref:hypothetical protein n=1 Tax=Mycobacterium sp. TaxID=1785 RepID=UPI003BB0A3E6